MSEDVSIDLSPKDPAPLNNGRYETRRLINIGGQANVYIGVDTLSGMNEQGTEFNRIVCIKEPLYFPTNPEQRQEMTQQLRREAILQAQMAQRFPGRVQEIYNFVLNGESQIPWIILKRNEGQSLKERLKKDYPSGLPFEEVVEIAEQLAEVLDIMNKEGLRHGDIKPANILKQEKGYKLTDFGSSTGVSSENTIINGTPSYMSPESMLMDDYDQIDSYGFAVTLYELLTGATPFEVVNDPVQAAVKAVNSKPIAITDWEDFNKRAEMANIDGEEVRKVFDKQFSKKKEDRYSNATEFSKALIHALTTAKTN